jgi:predicted metal-dependent hydrolase
MTVETIVNHKSAKIAAIIESFQGRELNPHYLGYFECFNQQLFFEAHEVLEVLWLRKRGAADELFYKGLIQLAGAFVHLQKQRPKPAAALFKLALGNLGHFGAVYELLEIERVQELIHTWLARLGTGAWDGTLPDDVLPKLRLSNSPA